MHPIRSEHFWAGVNALFYLDHQKVCTPNFSYILNGKSFSSGCKSVQVSKNCLFISVLLLEIQLSSQVLVFLWLITMYVVFFVINDLRGGSGLGLLCLTPLSTIFQLYRGRQFY